MPIIHIHSPGEIVVLSRRELLNPGVVGNIAIHRLRQQGAQATILKANFFEAITPPIMRGIMDRESSVWLRVDDSGEMAKLHSSSPEAVVSLSYPTSGGIEGGVIASDKPAIMIGADHMKNYAIGTATTGPTEFGPAHTALIGSLVAYRSAEQVAKFVDSFAPPPPPVEPPVTT